MDPSSRLRQEEREGSLWPWTLCKCRQSRLAALEHTAMSARPSPWGYGDVDATVMPITEMSPNTQPSPCSCQYHGALSLEKQLCSTWDVL